MDQVKPASVDKKVSQSSSSSAQRMGTLTVWKLLCADRADGHDISWRRRGEYATKVVWGGYRVDVESAGSLGSAEPSA